ncbi:Oxoglutarate/iron-dependent dioxygenase [uncultured Caudovirales phage]|uniref:Oxoglutarate/iron-dependent dioxygenase n=1 Tax=uncultured Caudovirales phage TaxID=2100421 RepID=A0A6J5P105_9CAUD|nr:Oxoglutarate/iron-dependent dioxygenase [uncultured Caudovirales phage]
MMKMEHRIGKKMTNSFVDVLGTNISNIKTGYDFLNQEELSYLLDLIKIGESRHNNERLHFSIFEYFNDNELSTAHEFAMNLNNKIFNFVTKAYDTDFIKEKNNWGLNVHRVTSFTDPHVDIIEHSPGPQKPGLTEPTYPNWRESWDGYLACNIYLNDDYDGGEVYFPDRNYTFKPKANSIVTWPGNKNFIHGITETKVTNRYVYGFFIKFAEYEKYDQ